MGKKNDLSKVVFKEPDNGKVILTVGKKDFHHHEHNQLFSRHNSMKLKKYDTEPEVCRSKLFEYQVTFPPSYPFSEDTEDGTSYMPTRCPGWCDRIMMSHDALSLFQADDGFTSEYKMIGMHICMGDHKPIYLNLQLRHDASAASGNNDSKDMTTACETNDDVENDSSAVIKALSNLISINGELVDFDSSNIHDFSVFEKEELLGPAFKDGLKHKLPSAALRAKRLVSFRNAVKSIIHSENLMRALKHYSHRSDSEETDEDEELKKNNELGKMECNVSANVVKSPCDDGGVFDASIKLSSATVSSVPEGAVVIPSVPDEIRLKHALISPEDHVTVVEKLPYLGLDKHEKAGAEPVVNDEAVDSKAVVILGHTSDCLEPESFFSDKTEKVTSEAAEDQPSIIESHEKPQLPTATLALQSSNETSQSSCETPLSSSTVQKSTEEASEPAEDASFHSMAIPITEIADELRSITVSPHADVEKTSYNDIDSPTRNLEPLSDGCADQQNVCKTKEALNLALPPSHEPLQSSFNELESKGDENTSRSQQVLDHETQANGQTVERLCQQGDDVETDRLLPSATVDSLKTPCTPLDADSGCGCCRIQ